MLLIFGFIGTLGLGKSDSFRMSLGRDFIQEPIFWPTDGQQNVNSSIFWIIAAAAVDKRQRLSWDMAAVRPQTLWKLSCMMTDLPDYGMETHYEQAFISVEVFDQLTEEVSLSDQRGGRSSHAGNCLEGKCLMPGFMVNSKKKHICVQNTGNSLISSSFCYRQNQDEIEHARVDVARNAASEISQRCHDSNGRLSNRHILNGSLPSIYGIHSKSF
jgi:hypothetical protein